MSQKDTGSVQQREALVSSGNAVQQSDNIAHALSGAGGGLLSMALTYAFLASYAELTDVY